MVSFVYSYMVNYRDLGILGFKALMGFKAFKGFKGFKGYKGFEDFEGFKTFYDILRDFKRFQEILRY